MSRTQQKLQAMSAQELLIQERKRAIEEKMRLNNAKKIHLDPNNQQNSNNNSNQQSTGSNIYKNDGSFLEKFHKSHGQTSTNQNTNTRYSLTQELEQTSQQFGPPWFPPGKLDQHCISSFPMPSLPFAPPQFPSSFLPPPFLSAIPPADFLSKILQTPPPPLPVPAPSTTINNEDLYDPLKAEEDDDEQNCSQKKETTSDQKTTNRTFNIKKEYTIKIEPNQSTSKTTNLSSLEHEHQTHDNGGNRRRQVATTSTDLSSSSALWWNDEDDEDNDNHQIYFNNKSTNYQQNFQENRKRKSRWCDNVSTDDKFVQQIHEATEKAKKFVAQLNEQMKLYPEGYDGTKMNDEQRGQFIEQKELQSIYQTMMDKRRELEKVARKQQNKYAYDSDEETDEKTGTWEHRLRAAEMDITREWAVKLTDMARGKHHIGDFIPPHELEKFMKTYSTLKEGQTPNVSDYREFKIQAENIGYRLLEKFGWKEGQGLGKNSQGILDPINKGSTPINHSGLGQDRPSELDRNDDEFQMYRKRMMLAYRFRPNPLNNPRRDYY